LSAGDKDPGLVRCAGIDEYQSEASISLGLLLSNQAASSLSREAPAMPVPSEPFAAVYEDRNRLGVIVARAGRGGFEAYAPDDHCLGLFPTPREAAAAITMARPWVARMTAEYSPELSGLAHLQSGAAEALR
jgi:hypothetical protein